MRKIFSIALFALAMITAMPVLLRSETPATDPESSLPLSALAVPEEIGKVQERFVGSHSRTVIQIQDVHAHAVAQQNIAAILERLRTMFGVEKAALEGAWSATSLPKSHALPTSREKQLLAGTLLEDDLLSGPIYAAIMSPDPITLVGIEEESLYEKNRELFLSHFAKSREVESKLQAYGASLQDLQRSTWETELLAFGTLFGKFRENSDLGKFLPLLLETADRRGAVSSDLTQVLLIRDIMALEKSLAKDRLEKEVKQVIKKYKNRPWTLEELVRGGKIPAEEIGLYPEIKKLTHLYQMRDDISLRDLMAQIGTLTGRTLEKLVRLPEESVLWEKTERFYLSKRLLLLQATPEDLKAYDSDRTVLEAELAKAGLSEPLVLSVDFYETVKKRDAIFFQRITTDPSLAGDIAVVTGGFHTDGLSQKFREAGISYITVTPELGGTAMNEKIYAQRMSEDRGTGKGEREPHALPEDRSPVSPPFGGQTLSELRNATAWVDKRFRDALEVLSQTRDVRSAVKFFQGETVSVSKDAKVRDLAARKLLRKNTGPDLVTVSTFRESEFMALPRSGQLEAIRQLIARADRSQQKAMLVSSVSALREMLLDPNAAARVKEIVARGDVLALAQDVPVTDMPEILLSTRGIDRFEAPDIATLVEKTPRFGRLAKKHPFVIMKNAYQNWVYVVLPEQPSSLVLYRIITLDDRLYQSAKNPEFLALLQTLVTDVLSQELSGKAA